MRHVIDGNRTTYWFIIDAGHQLKVTIRKMLGCYVKIKKLMLWGNTITVLLI